MENKKRYSDITLVCKTCNKEFNYSVSEQLFFEEKGFGAPVRCHDCRNAKKARSLEKAAKEEEKQRAMNIDPNEDWVAWMNAHWKEQLVLFGDKD